MNTLSALEKKYQNKNVPDFRPGDIISVYSKIKEGDKERIQAFEGVVIKRQRNGLRSSFTVRKMSYGVGVERVFPLHSPIIDKIEVLKPGDVRRSKLYYLRELSGKAARIKERRWVETLEKEVVQELAVEAVADVAPETTEEKKKGK
jgi:large subunit ribosomal protein L19